MNKKFLTSFSSLGLRIYKQRKTVSVFLTLAVLFLLCVPSVLALETGLQYGTATGLSTQDIRVSIMNVIRVILGLVGIIAIVLTIYAGYLWMTSAGNEEQIKRAKDILKNAVIGLIIILAAFSIVSFIIAMLNGEFGGNTTPGITPPPQGCENCGHLGSGIIESVYPAPLSKEVARDTQIIVTFKEVMTPNTIINGAAATCSTASPCNGTIAISGGKPNIRIYKQIETENNALPATEVNVYSKDAKTFVFMPIKPLGEESKKNWYIVKLTNAITRANGLLAFPAAGDYFAWNFEVGTKLDLLPPKVSSVFPIPDSEHDTYNSVNAVNAIGLITPVKLPNVDQVAAQSIMPTTATLNGGYNGKYSGNITITVGSIINQLTVAWVNASDPFAETSKTVSIDNGSAIITSGLSVVLPVGYGSGAQYTIAVTPKTTADTLRISNTTYKFTKNDDTGTNIKIPSSFNNIGKALLASGIINKVQSQVQSPEVNADLGSALGSVKLIAALAGSNGNNINIVASGNWATVVGMNGGADLSVSQSCGTTSPCDQPKNSVIHLDFNEGVSPIESAGKVETNGNNAVNSGAGTLKAGDFSNILVQADLNGNGDFEADEYVSGTFIQSNEYKTVEFVSLKPCLDASQNPIVNSCGDTVYCLPVRPAADYTIYKVTVKAADLQTCDATNAASCSGKGYEDGTVTDSCRDIPLAGGGTPTPVCGNTAGVYFMKANSPAKGVIDLSNNSLDGDKNNYAAGGQGQSKKDPYDLTFPVKANGDDLSWTFYINNKVDLTAPVVVSITPTVNGNGQSLTSPLNAGANKLLMSSSIKPGTGYPDGKCSCVKTAAPYDCPDADQICVSGQCINKSKEQSYCAQNNECNSGQTCATKKYVTLYDLTTQPVGWWVSNHGQDVRICVAGTNLYRECTTDTACGTGGICGQKDGYADRSVVSINHTAFLASTKYSGEMASGVKDIYQNCFIPGQGPKGNVNKCSISGSTCSQNSDCPASETCVGVCNTYSNPNGCCEVTASSPYCCNGAAQATPCTP